MSLILDALRKSEAERRRGQMPDLYAELPPLVHAAAPRRRAWPWWFAGLAVLLAAAALAWSQWASRTTAPDARPDDRVPMRIAAPAPAPVVSSPAPVASPPVAPAAAPKPAAAAPPQATAPVATAMETTTPAPKPMPPPAASEPSPSAAASPRYEAAIAAAATTTPAAPASPATAAPVVPLAPGTVRLSELSAGEREQLPALKISMHMWGPTPTQRFAIVDGTRVGQGDRVGEAVVEEIVADGVVLSWHGRRVWLPVR